MFSIPEDTIQDHPCRIAEMSDSSLLGALILIHHVLPIPPADSSVLIRAAQTPHPSNRQVNWFGRRVVWFGVLSPFVTAG